jgi:hypothetical protein
MNASIGLAMCDCLATRSLPAGAESENRRKKVGERCDMMATSYWYVREHIDSGLYHIVDANGASTAWKVQPGAKALCGEWIARDDYGYHTQEEGDMFGEPTCHACFRRAQ